jgi:hypothetical protein
MKRVLFCCALSLGALVMADAWACHGPGTSGAGVATQAAETLRRGQWTLEVRSDLTAYRPLGDLALAASRAGHLEIIGRSVLTTLIVSAGVTDDVQLGVAVGYYAGLDAVSVEVQGGATVLSSIRPDGVTDPWLTGRYRFWRGAGGQLALLAGLKLPVGRHDVRDGAGREVDPATTPGSGAFEGSLGLAHSRWLGERLSLDASLAYTIRAPHDGFRVGDRIDAGVALGYRLTENARSFPQPSLFAEASLRHLFRSSGAHRHEEEAQETSDPHVENSGGTVVFLGAGAKVAWRRLAFAAVMQVPVLQRLNGDQVEVWFKAMVSMFVTF